MPIRALIVADEPLARRSIRRFLKESPDVEVIAECGDGQSAVTAIREEKPDLVFLDVQMPEVSGLDVVREIGPDAMPVTIFVTAYDRYAVPAFDANAVDYLLKPFGKVRFARSLARARERLAGKANINDVRLALAGLQPVGATMYAQRVTAVENGRIHLIDVDDVDWIAADGNYAQVHTAGRIYAIRDTLTHLEASLDPHHFARIHRSTIVN